MNQIVSPAAQVIVSIIPIVGICFAASIIFFALLWKHHENVMLIQKDSYKPPRIDLRNFSLLLGLDTYQLSPEGRDKRLFLCAQYPTGPF